jgi:hypothetical protein
VELHCTAGFTWIAGNPTHNLDAFVIQKNQRISNCKLLMHKRNSAAAIRQAPLKKSSPYQRLEKRILQRKLHSQLHSQLHSKLQQPVAQQAATASCNSQLHSQLYGRLLSQLHT